MEQDAITELQDTEMVLPALNHQNTEIRKTKVVTCIKNGYTGDTYCLDCNALLAAGQSIIAKGHIWNAGKVTKKATATVKGKKVYRCTQCKAKKTEIIAATGAPKKGTILKKGKYSYKVTKKGLKNGTVAFARVIGNVKNVKIPKTITVEGITYKVTSIADKAFYKNKNITKITIGENVKTIGERAFTGCSNLKNISVEEGVTFTIGNYKYKILNDNSVECIGLKNEKQSEVTIAGMVKIGAKSYNVTSIGDKAFLKNKNIKQVTIHKNVKSVGTDALTGCSNLKKISADKETTFAIGDYKYKFTSTSTVSFAGVAKEKLKEVVIPNKITFRKKTYKVTAIADEALKYNKTITSVTMGDSIETIGEEAFFWCEDLMNVEIGKKVTTLGNNVFRGCGKIKDITIPDSVTNIGTQLFLYCDALKVISMPYSCKITGEFLPYGYRGIDYQLIFTGEKIKTNTKVFATEYNKITRYINGAGGSGYEILLEKDPDTVEYFKTMDLLETYLFKQGWDTTAYSLGKTERSEDEAPEGWNETWGRDINGYVIYAPDSSRRPLEICMEFDIHGWLQSGGSTWPEHITNEYYGADVLKKIEYLMFGEGVPGKYMDFEPIPRDEKHNYETCWACKKYPGTFEVILDFEEVKEILGLED